MLLFMIEENERILRLREKARRLPLLPGVYIMKNKSGTIIYIGKAKQLKNRVSQYFGAGNQHTDKVRTMVSHVEDFEYIITDSEYEALVLECSLIKQHTPRYNILLKDDKGYHYVKISSGDWKRITECKTMVNDGSTYLGPYTSSFVVKQAVDEANKLFQLPQCTRKFPQEFGKGRPCLNYFIKQCCAPCRGKISSEEYEGLVKEAVEYLRGEKSFSSVQLKKQMEQAAENLDFEKAARLRDRINALKRIQEKQKVVASKIQEQDVIALAELSGSGCIEVFRFTSGRLYDRESFLLGPIEGASEARSQFIKAYYTMRDKIPPQVTLDGKIDDMELLSQWLSQKAGRKVKITVPQKGEQYKLTEMCRNNAAETLAQDMGRTGKEAAALDELGRMLGLANTPSYIEAYDISNTAGSDNVAGMVVFEDGRPLKSAYRRFSIKDIVGQDDYGSMKEVIIRRLERYKEQKDTNEGFGRLPDLILLDGGKGHVATIQPVIRQYGLDIPVFGMVKDDKHRTRAITSDGSEIAINSSRSAFTLVSTIQEEVHRFAISFHRQKRSKSSFSSELEKIKGIGPAKAKALLAAFSNINRIKNAGLDELQKAPGMDKASAKAVYEYFAGQKDNQ